MAQNAEEDAHKSLEKVKKRLTTPAASCLMDGALLKRSETLRKWNQRWFTLDPSTGRMEYRAQHGDSSARGLINFEAESTITLSPINFHGARKYDGCCFYIGTPQKKEYYLCAETPVIARAWVSTLRAASLVLKAHKEAVDSLSGNGPAKLGTVYAVVAAANATAKEGMKEIEQSLRAAIRPIHTNSSRGTELPGDDVSTVMKETLRVKDEELNQVARDLRARDYMIKEIADRLSETAEAAEAAASAVRAMEKERTQSQAELDVLKKEFDDRLYHAGCEVRAGEERLAAALKAREIALQEAQRWRVELGKGREQIVMMEGAVLRAEDNARRGAADAEEKVKAAKASEIAALATKDDAINLAKQWQAQAEYYQGQAARYLGMLQQLEAATDSTTEQSEETIQAQKLEESLSEVPVHEVTTAVSTLKIQEVTTAVSSLKITADSVEQTNPEAPLLVPAPAFEVQTEHKSITDVPDYFSTYVTAVDFEQLQVDTIHFQHPPVPLETESYNSHDNEPPKSHDNEPPRSHDNDFPKPNDNEAPMLHDNEPPKSTTPFTSPPTTPPHSAPEGSVVDITVDETVDTGLQEE